MIPALSPEQLRRTFDPKTLGIETTEQFKTLEGIIGQKRAVSALQFGLEIQESGFNIYVAGPPGIGKMTAVQSFLEELAKRKDTSPDWCYINNFEDSYQPKVCRLPAGRGRQFQQDMKNLIEHVRREIPKAFESEEYGNRRDAIVKALDQERTQALDKLNEKANQASFMLQATPLGLATIPVMKGQPLSDTDFQALPVQTREDFQRRHETLKDEIKITMKQIRELERAAQEKLQALDQQVALYIVGELMEDLHEKYGDLPEVIEHLKAVQKDILENIETFKSGTTPAGQTPEPGALALTTPWLRELPFRKYQVNVLVDNSEQQGAPVVVELNPSYNNLFGRVEKEVQFGALYTDFTMIKAGSFHRANGGYLVMPVEDVLRNLLSWDGVKRALRSGVIEIEEIGERLGYMATKSLRPQPIPHNVKVVLVGRPLLYYLLHSYDEEFPELFKVKADFDTRMALTDENIRDFISFLCTFCQKENLQHLDSSAVAKVLEYSSRLAEDQEKLSTHFGALADIIREANFWALQENATRISARHVQKAIEAKIYRSNLIEERIQEMIARGTLLIDTTGQAVGQVNGLSVLTLGDYLFGKPSRITASVGPGREGIIDIEREVELGGPIHSKGVLILSGYLTKQFAQDKPLTLSARLVFEQSYEGVEGDSASSTELYTLLSALSGLPIKQGIAVTGSVNQHGEVQAIGGVNQKIEGFFDVCKVKGLTGEQGVIIPHSNVRNLMLREDVVHAVAEKKFSIWSVNTIDEGIEILTGVPAGQREPDGHFPEGTVFHRVEQRLREFGERLKEFGREKKNESE
ncbi:MAG: AAA family ATPase [candidate division KSB1 bacterium]|nr:AAA family ATPase [candidate division KSB1 bacterium]MDZ7303086.1 AAA family ATPase [candidate division KSB1 bacterium]MDZ7312625.1 AAA family ATPase [candidate division KSB1 bacterium]